MRNVNVLIWRGRGVICYHWSYGTYVPEICSRHFNFKFCQLSSHRINCTGSTYLMPLAYTTSCRYERIWRIQSELGSTLFPPPPPPLQHLPVARVFVFLFFVWSSRLFGSWLVPLHQYFFIEFPSFYSPSPTLRMLWWQAESCVHSWVNYYYTIIQYPKCGRLRPDTTLFLFAFLYLPPPPTFSVLFVLMSLARGISHLYQKIENRVWIWISGNTTKMEMVKIISYPHSVWRRKPSPKRTVGLLMAAPRPSSCLPAAPLFKRRLLRPNLDQCQGVYYYYGFPACIVKCRFIIDSFKRFLLPLLGLLCVWELSLPSHWR